ncbi:hypothetical protein D0Y65_010861, partial [Glycine soja]
MILNKFILARAHSRHTQLHISRNSYFEVVVSSYIENDGCNLQNFLQNTTLYFCRFAWDGAVHYFDIYVQDRDLCCVGDNQCSWKIYETQPCEIKLRSRECFQWN